MSDDQASAGRDDERRPRSTRWSEGGRGNTAPRGDGERRASAPRGRDERRGFGESRRDGGNGSGRGYDRGPQRSGERSYGDRDDRRSYGRGDERRGNGGRDDDRGQRFANDRGGYRGAGANGRGGRDGGWSSSRQDHRDAGSRGGSNFGGSDGGRRFDDRGRGGGYSDESRGGERRYGEQRGGDRRRDDRRFDDRGGDSRGRSFDGNSRGFDDGGRGRDDRRGRGVERRGSFDRGGSSDRRRSDERGGMSDRGGFNGRGERSGGWSNEQASIRGPRSWDAKASGDERPRRKPEPVLPEGITGYELDKSVRQQLRTLSKENAEGVAQHLVAAAELLEEDPQKALDHAQHAVSRAGRVPAAREALGLVLYRTGEYAEALREFRTARRLSGSDHLLPYMVDCERGLGRYERALELANSPEAQRLSETDNIELAIVVSGVRRDMGQARAAVIGLRIPALTKATTQPWAARLFYAYADALLAMDEPAEAREWFVKADAADRDGETDAADRIDQIDGFEMSDLTPEDEQDVDPRFAELDLSAFGAVKPAEASAPRDETASSDDESADSDGSNEAPFRPEAPGAVPSASFEDGSARD